LVEQKRKQEEEIRLQKEKAEQEEKEKHERQMKMQQEKEREIEERQRQKEEEIRQMRQGDDRQMRQADDRPADSWKRGGREDSNWRNEDIRPDKKWSPRMERSYGPPRGCDDGYDDRRREDGGWKRDDGGRWPGRDDRRGYRDERRDRDDDNWRRDDRSRDLSSSVKRGSEGRPEAVSYRLMCRHGELRVW